VDRLEQAVALHVSAGRDRWAVDDLRVAHQIAALAGLESARRLEARRDQLMTTLVSQPAGEVLHDEEGEGG